MYANTTEFKRELRLLLLLFQEHANINAQVIPACWPRHNCFAPVMALSIFSAFEANGAEPWAPCARVCTSLPAGQFAFNIQHTKALLAVGWGLATSTMACTHTPCACVLNGATAFLELECYAARCCVPSTAAKQPGATHKKRLLLEPPGGCCMLQRLSAESAQSFACQTGHLRDPALK